MVLPPSARVLRDNAPLEPFRFEVLDESAQAEAPVFPTFAPFPLVALAETDAPAEPSPEPDPAAVRQATHDAEVAALRAEVDRLTADLGHAAEALAETVRAAERTAETLGDVWREALRQLEPGVVSLAVEAAEAVLDAPLSPAQRAAVDQALAESVDGLANGGPVSVALSPVDLLHIQESGLARSLEGSHAGLAWEPDAEMAPGDWSVATPEAVVRRVRTDMLASLRARLGLDAL